MPKLKYEWAIIVACIGYLLGYDVFWSTVITLMSISLWNFFTDLPETFGYIRKERYLKVKKENQDNKKRLLELSDYITKINQSYISDIDKARIKDAATLDGQNKVFYVYLNDRAKFQYHLDEYIRVKVNNGRPKPSNKVGWRDVLGVDTFANKDVVDKAYKDLVKKYHPDINKDSDAISRMQSINEAKAQADKYFANT